MDCTRYENSKLEKKKEIERWRRCMCEYKYSGSAAKTRLLKLGETLFLLHATWPHNSTAHASAKLVSHEAICRRGVS